MMKHRDLLRHSVLLAAFASVGSVCHSQASAVKPASPSPIAASAPTAVPSLVPYAGTSPTTPGKAEELAVTFQIFKEESGGEPLWVESQMVLVDTRGHYQVQLGASNQNGLPSDLFATGEARWLEVQIAGQAQQARVLLASVPYALKASDAATLGGFPASAFVMRRSTAAAGAPEAPLSATNVTTTGGVAGYIPEFTGASTIVDSPLFVLGADLGIGTASPTATLDVVGTGLISGALTVDGVSTVSGGLIVPAEGTATTSASYKSEPQKIYTSAYNSATKAIVTPHFQWQAEPSGNNTSSPNATLNLLATAASSGATETGLSLNTNGTINFAPGQILPSSGIVSGDLSLPPTTSAATGVISVGGQPFLYGYPSGNLNAFVGGAGNFSTTGQYTTATGYEALHSQSSGFENTAVGGLSLFSDTTGSKNSAVGMEALYEETTGNSNTALGYAALFSGSTGSNNTAVGALSGLSTGALSNTTAIGSHATVGQNNTLVLGNTTTTPGTQFVNVGIGTSTPVSTLEASVSAPGALGPVLTLTNSGGNSGNNYGTAAIDFNTQPIVASGYNPGGRIEVEDDATHGTYFNLYTNTDGKANNGLALIGTFSGTVNYFMASLRGGTNDEIEGSAQIEADSPDGQLLDALVAVAGTAPNDSHANYGLSAYGGEIIGVNEAPTAGAAVVAQGGYGGGLANGGDGGDFYGGYSEGANSAGGYGLYVQGGPNMHGSINGVTNLAAYFDGNVTISGTLNGSTPQVVKIDHPLDAANKYLSHAAVQSSEMLDIYSGNVVTDELGLATVTLPKWFESLNTDFRYQLTTIGRDAHAWIAQKVNQGKFQIATNATRVEVSWQITAVRQDAYSKANPLVVEEAKPVVERGYYIQPALYGQPVEKQVEWGRRPEAMQRMKARREAHRMPHPQNTVGGRTLPHSSGTPTSAVNRNFTYAAPQKIDLPKAAKP